MPINGPVHRPINREMFVRRPRGNSRHGHDQGFVIILVAVFLLFVVGAMAALSIDVVTFYTARSEAQLAADAGALAGARVLANSGATSSDPTDPTMLGNAQGLAGPVAKQVAISNSVGGRNLLASEVTVNFNGSGNSPCSAELELQVPNPCVTVTVTRTDLPVFFARIWGSTQVTISASATAEAFNPSGLTNSLTISQALPIAPSCVKPLVLPNLDSTNAPIFDRVSGQIQNELLLGAEIPNLHARCGTAGSCDTPPQPQGWAYFAGDDTTASFQPPTQALPACATTNFETSIAGCIQSPIICGAPPASQVYILVATDTSLDGQAANAVNCLTNTSGNHGDTISPTMLPPAAFEFTAGSDNPLVQAGLPSGSTTMVSDSLVTVPIFDSPPITGTVGNAVSVIGFLQLFLQPSGQAVTAGQIQAKIINMVGCGLNSNPANSLVPVYGNGSSAVPVRLISQP